jgi:hypothetical protein
MNTDFLWPVHYVLLCLLFLICIIDARHRFAGYHHQSQRMLKREER